MPSLITPHITQIQARIESKVCKLFELSPTVIKSRNRTNKSSQARFVIWYVLNKRYHLSYKLISEMYDKHHTTVISGVKAVEKLGITQWINSEFPVGNR